MREPSIVHETYLCKFILHKVIEVETLKNTGLKNPWKKKAKVILMGSVFIKKIIAILYTAHNVFFAYLYKF